MASGSAAFTVKLNWRGKLLISALKVAVVLSRFGLHLIAERIVRRVMRTLENRRNWFDVSSWP